MQAETACWRMARQVINDHYYYYFVFVFVGKYYRKIQICSHSGFGLNIIGLKRMSLCAYCLWNVQTGYECESICIKYALHVAGQVMQCIHIVLFLPLWEALRVQTGLSGPLWGPRVYGSCWSAAQWWVKACVSDRVYVKCCFIQTHADVRPLTLQKKNQHGRFTVQDVTPVGQHNGSEMSISIGNASFHLFLIKRSCEYWYY